MKIYPYIFYCTVLRNTDPQEASPFVGISPSMLDASWTMAYVCLCPISILEPLWGDEAKLTRRIAGANYRFSGLRATNLPGLTITWDRPFWVMFSQEPEAARLIEDWRVTQSIPVMHVSSVEMSGAIRPDQFNKQTLAAHIEAALAQVALVAPEAQDDRERCLRIVRGWKNEEPKKLDAVCLEHNCTAVNNLVLEGAGYTFREVKSFSAGKDSQYVDAIIESYKPIDNIRAELPLDDFFKQLPPVPEVFVFAPAMFRSWYEPDAIGKSAEQIFGKQGPRLLRALQKQTGYKIDLQSDLLAPLVSSPVLQEIMGMRARELKAQTSAVAIRASSHFATTIRLPLGVNKSYGKLRQLAFNARSSDPKSRRKFSKLFQSTQDDLASYVDPRLQDRISRAQFGIKLICDAPLEWLPSGDLPLSLRHNVTRIPVTPGNLSISTLTLYPGIGLDPEAFKDVLHVDASPAGNAASGVVKSAIEVFDEELHKKMTVRHVKVSSIDEFVEVVNAYNGPMLVFDGHGSHSQFSDIGNIHIGNESCDVWTLRGRLKIPPIVFLSACDTHALDRSHATVANGFLALGAQSVVGTLLPIGILDGAVFVARFLYRIAEFIPAAIAMYGRSLRWPEVVTGMMKMQLATDVLRGLFDLGRLSEVQFFELSGTANRLVNSPMYDWYEQLLSATAKLAGQELKVIENLARDLVRQSDVVRYVHLGNGEHITIGKFDDEVGETG